MIVTAGSVAQAAVRARRALAELDVDGVPVNVALLRALLDRPELVDGTLDTAFVDAHLPELVPDVAAAERAPVAAPPGTGAALSTTHGVVVAIEVAEGDVVPAGAELVVLEAMKMQHVVARRGRGPGRHPGGQGRRHGRRRRARRVPRAGRRRRRPGAGRHRDGPRPRPRRPGRVPRTATGPVSTRDAPTRPVGGTRRAGAPRARTSTTCSTPTASSSTARSRSPPSARAAASRTSSPAPPPTG